PATRWEGGGGAEADGGKVERGGVDEGVGRAGDKAGGEGSDTTDFLVDPEPGGEPVDGADLLDRIVDAVNAHMILTRGAAESVALWVLHAHAHDCFLISPVLGITSPTPECGKSTLLTIVGAMVPRALTASNISTSSVF